MMLAGYFAWQKKVALAANGVPVDVNGDAVGAWPGTRPGIRGIWPVLGYPGPLVFAAILGSPLLFFSLLEPPLLLIVRCWRY